jgi:hypothetical protein
MTKVIPIKKKPVERPLYPGGIDDLPFVERCPFTDRGDCAAKVEMACVCRAAPSRSCGCVLCDIELPVYRDDRGFYHDGPEDTRIACGAPEDIE